MPILGGVNSPAILAVLTMWPWKFGSLLAASSIMGVNKRTPCTTPHKFTPSNHSQSATVFSQTKPPAPTPALLKTKFGAPNVCCTSFARACMWPSLDTSTKRAITSAPSVCICACAASNASFCTSTSTSFMPNWAPIFAHSKPKPEPAPVRTATLPLKFDITIHPSS